MSTPEDRRSRVAEARQIDWNSESIMKLGCLTLNLANDVEDLERERVETFHEAAKIVDDSRRERDAAIARAEKAEAIVLESVNASSLAILERDNAIKILRVLVEALPKCEKCYLPATRKDSSGSVRWCDKSIGYSQVEYAAPLRAALALLAGKSEEVSR